MKLYPQCSQRKYFSFLHAFLFFFHFWLLYANFYNYSFFFILSFFFYPFSLFAKIVRYNGRRRNEKRIFFADLSTVQPRSRLWFFNDQWPAKLLLSFRQIRDATWVFRFGNFLHRRICFAKRFVWDTRLINEEARKLR